VFRVKPFSESGWNLRQRYEDDLGADKVYCSVSYTQVLAQSRLVVCTYPETTLSEVIVFDLPALLLYPTQLWELHPTMQSLLETLKKAKIVFHDPVACAEHASAIWENPEVWWNSPDVLQAREEFHKQALDLEGDWLKQWASFIKDETFL
jgi:putative transferase (TIGR04331 family)